MNMLLEIIGWLGALLVLGAYALLSMKKLSPNGYAYHAINIGGAGLLAVYTYSKGAMPSALLNIIWCGIGIGAMVAAYRAKNSDA